MVVAIDADAFIRAAAAIAVIGHAEFDGDATIGLDADHRAETARQRRQQSCRKAERGRKAS